MMMTPPFPEARPFNPLIGQVTHELSSRTRIHGGEGQRAISDADAIKGLSSLPLVYEIILTGREAVGSDRLTFHLAYTAE